MQIASNVRAGADQFTMQIRIYNLLQEAVDTTRECRQSRRGHHPFNMLVDVR